MEVIPEVHLLEFLKQCQVLGWGREGTELVEVDMLRTGVRVQRTGRVEWRWSMVE